MADPKTEDAKGSKSKEEIENIKRDRAASKAETDDSGGEPSKSTGSKSRATKKPRAKRRSKAQIADEMFPIDTWRNVSDFVLDGATNAANTAQRSNDEKQAFAVTGRAVAVKRLPSSQYAEEIMFGMVAVPIALSIFFEALGNYREKRDKQNASQKTQPTPSNIGQVGQRQDVSNQRSYPPG